MPEAKQEAIHLVRARESTVVLLFFPIHAPSKHRAFIATLWPFHFFLSLLCGSSTFFPFNNKRAIAIGRSIWWQRE